MMGLNRRRRQVVGYQRRGFVLTEEQLARDRLIERLNPVSFADDGATASFEPRSTAKPRKWFFAPKGDDDSAGLGRLFK